MHQINLGGGTHGNSNQSFGIIESLGIIRATLCNQSEAAMARSHPDLPAFILSRGTEFIQRGEHKVRPSSDPRQSQAPIEPIGFCFGRVSCICIAFAVINL